MKGIFKKFIKKDQHGRVLSITTERLVDNGRGRISVTTNNRVLQCPGCGRHVSDVSELRGKCHFCFSRTCCDHSESKCSVCSRRLCPVCRRGFTNGQSLVTTCPNCLVKLKNRLAYQDRLLLSKMTFDRQRALNQERVRLLQNGLVLRLPDRRVLISPRWLGVIQRFMNINRLFSRRGRHNGRYLR